ncbi:MAG: hypothetical protein JXP34_11165 [Planctomycetes bacterium]|nr:hypothetical protein [Planctomycetota bacterium]
MVRMNPARVARATLLACAMLVPALPAPEPETLFRPATSGASSLRIVNGIPVVTLAGTPREIGRAYGTLVRDALAFGLKGYIDPIVGDPPESGLVATAKAMDIPAWAREEMAGMAEGSGLSYERILLTNTIFDMKKFLLCTAVCVSGDPPLFGRNLDYPDSGVLVRLTTVFVVKPTGKKPFVSIGFPGLVGVLTGWNEDGLAAAVLEVYGHGFRPAAMPYGMLFREILEEESAIAGAADRLRRSKISTGNNLAVMDRSGGAVLEISPSRIVERRGSGPIVFATNHFRAEVHAQRGDWRDGILDRTAANGIDGQDALRSLLDRVSFRSLTLQSMVIAPTRGEVWLASGAVPATKRPYVHLGPDDLVRIRAMPADPARKKDDP